MANFDINYHRRKTNTRNKLEISVPFELVEIKNHFDSNLNNIISKFEIANLLKKTSLQNAEDIWRSQIVFLDSALDFYIHEITKYGMVKILSGEYSDTDYFDKFRISMKFVKKIIKYPENINKICNELDSINQKNCFMSYKNIYHQLKLIGIDVNISSFQTQIDLLYKRRNEIAHQADCIPETANKKTITEENVRNYIKTVKDLQKLIQKNLEKLQN